jgi:hypothetical protein
MLILSPASTYYVTRSYIAAATTMQIFFSFRKFTVRRTIIALPTSLAYIRVCCHSRVPFGLAAAAWKEGGGEIVCAVVHDCERWILSSSRLHPSIHPSGSSTDSAASILQQTTVRLQLVLVHCNKGSINEILSPCTSELSFVPRGWEFSCPCSRESRSDRRGGAGASPAMWWSRWQAAKWNLIRDY